MSNTGKFCDRAPFLQHAGHSENVHGLTADISIRQDLYMNVKTRTPESIKKYRNSTKERIGVKQLHYGIFDDDKTYQSLMHGCKTKYSDHVPDCIKSKNDSGVNHFVNQIKESKYSSSKREPLGQRLQRNYDFPDKIKTNDDFRFGNPIKDSMLFKILIKNIKKYNFHL